MKILFFPILFVIFSTISISASAQLKGFSFGPYVEAAWPKGAFEQQQGNGFGLGVTADINLPGHFSATGSAGFLHFRKSIDSIHAPHTAKSSMTALPLRAGLKYKLPVVYLKIEGGAAKSLKGEASSLIISPGLGARILGLDIQGNYETWIKEGSKSFWGLRIAYHF